MKVVLMIKILVKSLFKNSNFLYIVALVSIPEWEMIF